MKLTSSIIKSCIERLEHRLSRRAQPTSVIILFRESLTLLMIVSVCKAFRESRKLKKNHILERADNVLWNNGSSSTIRTIIKGTYESMRRRDRTCYWCLCIALGTSIYRVLNMNGIKYILGVTRLIIKVMNMMINVQSI